MDSQGRNVIVCDNGTGVSIWTEKTGRFVQSLGWAATDNKKI